jgi:branched-chain amino acid transport system substrate-binding protein
MLYLYDSIYEGGLADHYTFVFSSMPEQNLKPVIDYLYEQGNRKFYILATDYNYGILSCEWSKYFIQELGGEVVTAEYVPNSKSDFSVTIENILVHNPDVVVTILVGERQSEFFTQWHEKGNRSIKLINTSAIPQAYMHLTAAEGILENLYFSASYTEELDTEGSARWINKVRNDYSKKMIPYLGCDHEAAYLALLYYKAAADRAKSTDTESVIRGLESGKIEIEAPGGYSYMNPVDHHLVRDVGIYRVDETNKVELLEKKSCIRSTFVGNILERQYGVRGGLKELGKRSPDIQYNLLLNKL